MPSFRMRVEYDGSGFSGWQRQSVARTVQGELEKGLTQLCRHPIAIVGAGRTDAGVHATGQVASFDLNSGWRYADDAALLGRRLDRIMPPDISVHDMMLAPDGFSARFNARRRRYRYSIRHVRHPLERAHSWFVPQGLDLEAMVRATEIIRKYRDFRAFTRADLKLEHYYVDLDRLDLVPQVDGVDLVVSARRFLHNMVRILAGTLVAIGKGRMPPERVARAIETRDRRLGGPTAPPHGLILEAVEYLGDPLLANDLDLPAAAAAAAAPPDRSGAGEASAPADSKLESPARSGEGTPDNPEPNRTHP